MGELLKALYEDRIKAEPVIEKRDKERQKACDTAYGLLEELSERLTPEDRELLEKAVNALNYDNYCYTVERFARGYRLGALMMQEIMEDREDFILKEACDEHTERSL